MVYLPYMNTCKELDINLPYLFAYRPVAEGSLHYQEKVIG